MKRLAWSETRLLALSVLLLMLALSMGMPATPTAASAGGSGRRTGDALRRGFADVDEIPRRTAGVLR
jgi:hypothetical protein